MKEKKITQELAEIDQIKAQNKDKWEHLNTVTAQSFNNHADNYNKPNTF